MTDAEHAAEHLQTAEELLADADAGSYGVASYRVPLDVTTSRATRAVAHATLALYYQRGAVSEPTA